MSTPFYQGLDPQAANDPVTPQASPSDPAGYASVTPHGQGPAPYNIQAPMEDLTAIYAASCGLSGGSEGAPTGAGLSDMHSPRQAQAEALLMSPQGYGAVNITAGWSGSGGDTGWPNDVRPGPNATTPDQGMGDFTGTGTD